MRQSSCHHCCAVLGKGVRLGRFPLWYGLVNPRLDKKIGRKTYPANLAKCERCGLVQQIVSSEISEILDFIYTGEFSNASTTLSDEGWGKRRADFFLDEVKFTSMPERVLEVGCGSGYLLKEFLRRGTRQALGYEPSARELKSCSRELTIIPEFFTLEQAKKHQGYFDVVISYGVLEHVPNVSDHLQALRMALKPNGRLLCSVPGTENSARHGNLGLFIHEHVNYFSKKSISRCLRDAGFFVEKIVSKSDFLYIETTAQEKAQKIQQHDDFELDVFIHNHHQVVSYLTELIEKTKGTVGFYGACCGLANALSLLPAIKEYAVFDSDSTKWGNRVSGVERIVEPPDKDRLSSMGRIIIIPFDFQEEIYWDLKKVDAGLPIEKLYPSYDA